MTKICEDETKWLDMCFNSNQKCGPMPNVMAALPNVGGAVCSTPQILADVHY